MLSGFQETTKTHSFHLYKEMFPRKVMQKYVLLYLQLKLVLVKSMFIMMLKVFTVIL